jgi:hypothetical protein
MPQDANSGRYGNTTGRLIARKVAEFLGTTLVKASNECLYNSKVTVIKSTKYRNNKIGITKKMLERVEQVILASQHTADGNFTLYTVSMKDILDFGTETRSKGASKDKVICFTVPKAIKYGSRVGDVEIDYTI